MAEIITSVHNPRVKNIIQLQSKSRERKSQNTIVIEGYREITRAIIGGLRLNEIFYCPDIDTVHRLSDLTTMYSSVSLTETSRQVFEKIAYRETSDGLIALATPAKLTLSQLRTSKFPLIIVLEAVEKPGNLGAIMRTADAAGVDAVIVCDPLSDIYNPNVIRSSVGCVFTVPVVASDTREAQQWLTDNNIKSYAAALTPGAVSYESINYHEACAIILGTEATGLSEKWLNFCNCQIIIPMHGIADSLNVSTSAAIIVFEALRQRRLNKKF